MILALVFLFTATLNATPASRAITQARGHILKKERQLALKQLSEQLEKDLHKAGPRAELIREIDRQSKLFLTEEGQKHFELAESLLYAAKPGAIDKYEEALKTEDMNVIVLFGLARAQLAEGNCSLARQQIDKIDKLNPFWAEKKILKARIDLCLNQATLSVETDPAYKADLKNEYKVLQSEVFTHQKKIKEAKEALKSINTKGSPEVYYLLFKLHEPVELEALQYAQNYLDACKGANPALRRENWLQPRMCLNKEEAEAFISKSEANK